MCLQSDAVDKVSSVFIDKCVYKFEQCVGFKLFIEVVVIQVDAFRCIFICKIECIPQVIVSYDLGPAVLSDGAVIQPCFVNYIVCLELVDVAQVFKCLENVFYIVFHSIKHCVTVYIGFC